MSDITPAEGLVDDASDTVADTTSPPATATGDSPAQVRTTGDRPASRGKSVASAVAGVVAVLGLLGGIIGFWSVDTATDPDWFQGQVEEQLRTEQVSNALAARIVADVATALDLRNEVEALVPEDLQPIVDPLLAGVRARVESRVGELIRTDAVVDTVGDIAGEAYRVAVRVVEGDSVIDDLTIVDGQVQVNLLPLVSRVLNELQQFGILQNVDVPEFERDGDPDQQRAELSSALGRDLPADFGTPVMFEEQWLDSVGDTVQTVRDLLVFAKRTYWFFLIGGVVFAGLSIWLARHRLRAAAYMLAGFFVGVLITQLTSSRVVDRMPDMVDNAGAKQTVSSLADDLRDSLNTTLVRFSLLALVALAIAIWAVYEYHRRGGGPQSADTDATAVG